MLKFIFIGLGSYLIGSFPSGYLIGRLKGIDIRRVGSGNIGATNVYRTLGKGPAILTFLLDVGKGIVAVVLGKLTGNSWFPLFAGLLAILGHNYSAFLSLKGGKGVATGFGVIIGLFPLAALFIFLVWSGTLLISGYVSISSLVASFSLPLFLLWQEKKGMAILALIIFLFILYSHRENIKRLVKGKEPKV